MSFSGIHCMNRCDGMTRRQGALLAIAGGINYNEY